jgi:hypothetical protein
MNPLVSAISRYIRRPHRNRGRIHMGHRKARRTLLYLEPLEERMVPASLSVADVNVREGPTSTGILDPAGAASVGISGVKGIIFDSGPSDPHYGDLFVTGYLSHSVARFDWASQTYQPFVLASNNGGLNSPDGITVGPDGNVYVSDPATNIVFRYDASGNPLPAPGQTGAVFVPAASGGLNGPSGLAFGPDGSLLVLLCPSCPLIKASRWQAFTLSPVIQACLLVATQTSVHPPTHPPRTMITQPLHQQARH